MIDIEIEGLIGRLTLEQAQNALRGIFERLDRVRESEIALKELLRARITVIDDSSN
jgi:hypothetical protein